MAQNFFQGVDLFKYLTESQLERMARVAAKVSFPAGKIIREFDPPDGMYIIESGIAKMTKSPDGSGAEAELASYTKGAASVS